VSKDLWIPIESIDASCKPLVGNKVYRTALLQKLGYSVPLSACLTLNAYEAYIASAPNLPNDVIVALKNLQNYLHPSNREDFKTTTYAVRSSAVLNIEGCFIEEDSGMLSMAGWFESVLNTPINALELAVLRCYKAFRSERCRKNYLHHFGTENPKGGLALLIQIFHRAERSAVIFSLNPYRPNREEILISANPGACIGLVSGRLTGDTYWISRRTRVVRCRIVDKTFLVLQS
jgi:phosphoenolpyruvate synthase/pyruvate phosphate dikinase